MKKSLLSVSFIFIALFICTSDVLAYHFHKDATNAVDNGSAVLVCDYYDPDAPDDKNKGAKIYYHFKTLKDDWRTSGWWDVFFKHNSKFDTITPITDAQDTISYGPGYDVFIGSGRIFYNSRGEHFPVNIESTFKCPKNAFIDYAGFGDLLQMCFSENSSCGTGFDVGPISLQESEDTIFGVIDKYASDSVYNSISDEEFLNGDIKAIIINRTLEFTKIKYSFGTTYDMPAFITSYINEIHTHVADNNKYDERAAKIKTKADQDQASGAITPEQHDEIVEKLSQSYYDVMGVTSVIGVNPSDDPKCIGLLGVQMTKIVNNIFTFVQFAGPILVVVLTIVDFIKAAIEGTQDEIKKSSQRFMKRVIAAMALFFVPLICGILFDLAGVTVPEHCIGIDTTQQ